MKYLYFLLVVAASQARVVRDIKRLEAPILTRVTTIDPPGFVADWTPVKNLDSSDPILGYKVKVWEQDTKKEYHYETIDGVNVLVAATVPNKFPNVNELPEGKPKEYVVNGADKTTLKVDHIKIGTVYEIRVQAYTEKVEGPLSQAVRIQIMPDEEDKSKDVYTVA